MSMGRAITSLTAVAILQLSLSACSEDEQAQAPEPAIMDAGSVNTQEWAACREAPTQDCVIGLLETGAAGAAPGKERARAMIWYASVLATQGDAELAQRRLVMARQDAVSVENSRERARIGAAVAMEQAKHGFDSDAQQTLATVAGPEGQAEPLSADDQVQRDIAWAAAGNANQALASIISYEDEAAAVRDAQAKAYAGVAVQLAQRGEFERAHEIIEEASIGPAHHTVSGLAGMALAALSNGELEQASIALEEAVTVTPGVGFAVEGLRSLVRLAEAYDAARQSARSVTVRRQAVAGVDWIKEGYDFAATRALAASLMAELGAEQTEVTQTLNLARAEVIKLAQEDTADALAQAKAYAQISSAYISLDDLVQAEAMAVRILDAGSPKVISVKGMAQAEVAGALALNGDSQAALDLVATIRTSAERAYGLSLIAQALAPKDLVNLPDSAETPEPAG